MEQIRKAILNLMASLTFIHHFVYKTVALWQDKQPYGIQPFPAHTASGVGGVNSVVVILRMATILP